MEGIEKKKEVYDQMGVTVIWLYPEDLWERTVDREGVSEFSAIGECIR
jgi:competence CoiA-like predicted nuclease